MVTTYTYDAMDRLAEASDAAAITFAYDRDGDLTGVTDGNGGVTGYDYDLRGNLTSTTP